MRQLQVDDALSHPQAVDNAIMPSETQILHHELERLRQENARLRQMLGAFVIPQSDPIAPAQPSDLTTSTDTILPYFDDLVWI